MRFISLICVGLSLALQGCSKTDWVKVDDFEAPDAIKAWHRLDVDNQTDPFIESPQISDIKAENGNHFMIRKPAAEGVIGNRKAIGLRALPVSIAAGDIATLYVRFNVEAFPNNHSFGLTNRGAGDMAELGYNAFEPMFRITDKAESDGTKNDGTFMVLTGPKTYAKIKNPKTGEAAKPLDPNIWYEMWGVINNAPVAKGGQSYDLYMRGGEFTEQIKVFEGAQFRMKREEGLIGFMAISNTGPKRDPYGNGGVRYDDIFIANGRVLTTP